MKGPSIPYQSLHLDRLAGRLHRERDFRGLTVKNTCDLIGIPRSHLRNHGNGKSNPSHSLNGKWRILQEQIQRYQSQPAEIRDFMPDEPNYAYLDIVLILKQTGSGILRTFLLQLRNFWMW